VLMYALVQLILYVKKYFLRVSDLSFLLANLNIWALFLSDVQYGGPQLLQLTAGDAHHRRVESIEAQKHDDVY
jgi:hypothetical protein